MILEQDATTGSLGERVFIAGYRNSGVRGVSRYRDLGSLPLVSSEQHRNCVLRAPGLGRAAPH